MTSHESIEYETPRMASHDLNVKLRKSLSLANVHDERDPSFDTGDNSVEFLTTVKKKRMETTSVMKNLVLLNDELGRLIKKEGT